MDIKSLKRKTGFDSVGDYTDYLVRLADDLHEMGMEETAKDVHTAALIIFQEVSEEGSLNPVQD